MATVWIAEDPVLSRRVAVKILRADLAEDDALRVRFRNEAIAAAKLSHPNIVATYDTGDDDGTAYIVMELVNGPTLRRIIDEVGGMPVRDVLRIGEQVADALDAAHRAGLVHRDVKPANVLVPEVGPVKVTDFGIAKAIGTDDLTRTGTVMGTARYLAPEQVNGHVTDARTDVYGLGLMLFEMLCGHPPFGGDTEIATAMARLTTAAPSIRAERPDVPAELDHLVHRCLARQPDARFASAGAASLALQRLRTQATTRSTQAPAPRPQSRPPQSRQAAAAAPGASQPTPRQASRPASRPGPKPARRSTGWLWVIVAFVIVLALAAVAVYLAREDDATGGGSGSGSLDVTAQVPSNSAAIVGASAFDPLGGDGESDASAENAIDGAADTAWPTECYVDFNTHKRGVGLSVTLEREQEIHTVRVDANPGGWSGEIYVADEAGSTLASWGSARRSDNDVGASHTFELDKPVRGRAVLVWLVQLPQACDNGQRQHLEITEVTVA